MWAVWTSSVAPFANVGCRAGLLPLPRLTAPWQNIGRPLVLGLGKCLRSAKVPQGRSSPSHALSLSVSNSSAPSTSQLSLSQASFFSHLHHQHSSDRAVLDALHCGRRSSCDSKRYTPLRINRLSTQHTRDLRDGALLRSTYLNVTYSDSGLSDRRAGCWAGCSQTFRCH